MKRRIVVRTLLTVVAATLAASISAIAQVGGAPCSLARAAGTYGVSDSGTIAVLGPRAAVGLLTLDATGNITATVTVNISGSVTTPTLSGTYSVASNCTGTTTFKEFDQSGNLILTAEAALVWDANMQEIRFLFTSVALEGKPLQTVISGNARKLVP